jgi:hypothetical protein
MTAVSLDELALELMEAAKAKRVTPDEAIEILRQGGAGARGDGGKSANNSLLSLLFSHPI